MQIKLIQWRLGNFTYHLHKSPRLQFFSFILCWQMLHFIFFLRSFLFCSHFISFKCFLLDLEPSINSLISVAKPGIFPWAWAIQTSCLRQKCAMRSQVTGKVQVVLCSVMVGGGKYGFSDLDAFDLQSRRLRSLKFIKTHNM